MPNYRLWRIETHRHFLSYGETSLLTTAYGVLKLETVTEEELHGFLTTAYGVLKRESRVRCQFGQ